MPLLVALVLGTVVSVHPRAEGQRPRHQHDRLDRAIRALVEDGHAGNVRVIIRAPGARDDLQRRLTAHGDRVHAHHFSIESISATVHAQDLEALADDPAVERVSIDARVRVHETATATHSLLPTEGLPENSGSTRGGSARIAVIDSGLELTGDLGGSRIIGFYDFTRGGVAAAAYDDYGHGTHVAGLIAGDGSKSNGYYAGIAPAAKVLALKVLDQYGGGYTSDVIAAIEFVVANQKAFGIHAINLSLGHPIYEPAATDPLVQAIEKASQAGILVIVAAGNFGQNPATGLIGYGGITSPGNAPSAVTVGGVNTFDTVGRGDDVVPGYSSRGPTWYDGMAKPDIVSPGHRLVSIAALKGTLYKHYPDLRVTGNSGDVPRYFRLSGTSMAAAVTTGSVALMLDAAGSKKKSFTPNLVKALLQWSAIPIHGFDALTQGTGSLNVPGALALTRRIDTTMPVGSFWLTSGAVPSTSIAGTSWPWAQMVFWGNLTGSGSVVDIHGQAWNKTIVWGNAVVWDGAVAWGTDVVWGDPTTWSSAIVWGNDLIGTTDGTTIVWGNTTVTSITIVWGNASATDLSSTGTSLESR
ncbi:MAG: S8 family peptidase [Vicinamibacterales bacterium]